MVGAGLGEEGEVAGWEGKESAGKRVLGWEGEERVLVGKGRRECWAGKEDEGTVMEPGIWERFSS